MHDTSTIESRIARSLTLRRLEFTAITATVAAFVLTITLVDTTRLAESNWIVQPIVDRFGWTGAGLLGIGVEAAAFGLFRRLRTHRYRGVRPAHVGGVIVASIGIGDLLVNLIRLGQVGLPPLAVDPILTTAGPVVLGAVAVISHPFAPRPRSVLGVARSSVAPLRRVARRAAPAVVAVLIVTSTMGGLAFVGTQPLADGQSGTASAAAGDAVWNFSTGGPVKSSVTVVDGVAFVGSNDNSLYAIDVETGQKKWSVATGGSISSSPTVSNGTVFVGSQDNSLYAFDAANGSQQWSVATGSGIQSSPTISNGTVYVGSGSSLYAFDAATGNQKWSKALDGSVGLNSPSVVNGSVFITSKPGTVYSFDADTGSEDWSTSTGEDMIDISPAVDNGSVFVGTFSGTFYSFDADAGNQEWSVGLGSSIYATTATVKNGTVYVGENDGDLNALDAATGNQLWTYTTGAQIYSSPTVAGGTVYVGSNDNSVHAVAADTGSLQWTYATQGQVHSSPTVAGGVVYVGSDDGGVRALETSHTKDSSGSRNRLHTLGHVGGVYQSAGGSTGAADINGTVSTHSNEGVANATVQLTISKEPSIPQADAQLDDLSNPIPSAYEQQIQNGFDLLGDGGFLEDRDGEYAAIYDPADLGLTYKDSADLSEPKITNVEPGEQQAIILGDTTADCGIFGVNTNEYNQQIPGCVQPEGNVTIEKLSGTGDVVATDSVSVQEAGNQRDFGGPTDVHYATYTFTEGIYRISPTGEDGISYLIKAGNPTPDFNRYSRTVENQFTTQAQNMRDAIDQDLLEVQTVTTNETGHWNASLPDNAKLVTVSARKAPGVDVDPANLTYENMTEAYNSANSPNASVYLPSRTKRVSPPASNVEVTLTEVPFPSFANLDKYQNRIQQLENKLNNLTMDDLPQQMLQRLETQTRNDIAPAWKSLRGTLMNYEPARETYLEISGRESVPTASELSKEELVTAIQNGNVALTQASSTGQLTETATETTQDTISKTWELTGMSHENANISVIADYSNGTSRVVDDEYIATDSSIAGTETISVQEFPLGEDDPEQVSFRLRVAGNNELAETTSSVLNPTFAGEVPSIDAVEVTSLQPGPSDRVTVEIHPDDQSTFERVTQMTVRGPDGSTIETSNITDGTTASFTTTGAGTHSIRFTVESSGGATFTDVVQIEAADSDESLRPSIYAHSGPLGTFAVVGDGFESGDVETTSTGSLEVVGVLGADQEPPNTVDVFLEGVDVGTESTTTIRIVRGDSRQSVRANVPMVIHTPTLNSPEDDRSYKTLVRANQNPITWAGDTRYGVVEQDDDGASIKAYTADNGVLTLSLDNTPTWVERNSFWLDTNYPWVPLTVGTTPLLGGFVVVSRRRRSN